MKLNKAVKIGLSYTTEQDLKIGNEEAYDILTVNDLVDSMFTKTVNNRDLPKYLLPFLYAIDKANNDSRVSILNIVSDKESKYYIPDTRSRRTRIFNYEPFNKYIKKGTAGEGIYKRRTYKLSKKGKTILKDH